MATDLSEDAVLSFVQNNGGSVKNSDLLLHFRSFIRDHADRDRNRTLFKKFVNSVATVRQDDGVSYIVLKKQFRGYVPRGGGGGSSGPPRVPAGKITEPSPQSTNQIPAASAEKARLKPLPREGGAPAPPGDTARTTILPAAGLMVNNNNNVETTVNLKQLNSTAEPSGRRAAAPVFSQLPELKTPSLPESPVQDERTKEGQQRGLGPLPEITPVVPTVRHHRETKGREAHLQSEGGLHQEPPLHHEVPPQRIRHRPSYKSAVSCDEEEEELPVRRSPGGAVWPVSAPPRDTGRPVLFSSPRIIHGPTVISSSSSERKPPKIFIQDIEGESLVSRSPGWSSEGLNHGSSSAESASTRRSLPLEAESYAPSPDPRPLHADHQDRRHSQTAGVQLEPAQGLHQKQRAQLSSSHSSVFSSSSDAGFSSSDWPPSGSSRGSGWNSSFDDLQAKTGKTGHVAHIQEVLQRAQETKLESTASPWHHMSGNLHDDQESADHKLHLSTGDLLDNREEVESSDCSASTPVLRHHLALPRRLSREVRSRMCRSLGTDLDQIHQEGGGGGGNETARLNRLHLISSSLSLRANLSTSSLSSCSTPPRCQSLAELHEETELKGGVRSLPAAAATSSATRHEGHVGHSRQSLVPLEPREHAWFVKGAAGAWPDIYSLFREDPSLLNKQDFISGFTVLHWIVKHGDHRVLNTLWYGVEKAGLTLNINTRSTCGHTPLHIAAMHGRSNMIRLLVKKFYADVKQRDIAGKRPWQYLSCSMVPEIFQLLGAPARAAVGEVGRLDQQQRQQQQQQRRRRHHLSSAFGERPLTTAGASKVKRSTSLAAFLKHKPLLPFHGQQSDI